MAPRRHLRRAFSSIALLAALALTLLAPSALARNLYVGNYDAGALSVVDTATNQVVGGPIPVGAGPYSIAVTPDGRTAYVANQVSADVTAVDTQTNQVVAASIPVGTSPETIAIAPDGGTAFVTNGGSNDVSVIDTRTNQVVGEPIPAGAAPYGVAVSPDGTTVYVANRSSEDVTVIDARTRQVVGEPIPVGAEPINVAFSPDGKSAYVDNEGDGTISVIDTQTRQVVGEPITVGGELWGLAVAPDGTRLYVSDYADDSVFAVDTRTRQVSGPIPTGEEPYEIAITPDGRTAYVANYEGQSVTVIDTRSNQPFATIPVAGGPWQVAIVPDQSPTASFTAAATKPGGPFAFSGLTSTDLDGSIGTYDWTFGDGQSAANGGATPLHEYASQGSYPASLTVTDNEGCSVAQVFTGRTAYCSGSPASTYAQTVGVEIPNDFQFRKITRNRRKGIAKVRVRVPLAGALLLSGKKVRQVKRKAAKKGTVVLTVRPRRMLAKALKHRHHTRLRIKVTFSPTGGTPRTKGKSLGLVRHKRHHRRS